ncbi:Uncharacterized SPBc2 prophage-derived protein YoqJ [Pilibacter termitis]|uniref:UPF0398 protein SAMN02745116_02448 n=1 Tax=Pilibacter termitis TaxID=263852 RepID=A0A1T4R5Y9_9ENTE|nr:DUF1273 domain-containing protein [Pilibacter termitis]SKA11359.1 Uncharacterized SPBc2 prophage-derived protein YoqJ [Pilibacter termitis]
MQTIFISGYRSFELAIFQENDPKLVVIKYALTRRIKDFLEQGVEWFLISGNLGTELWAGEIVLSLKEEYPQAKLGMIFPFEEFGSNWNEQNQMKLQTLKSKADYVNATSHKPYETPAQLRSHTQFLLQHTQGALLLYDSEMEGKPKWLLRDILKKKEIEEYTLCQISMDELQETAEILNDW